MIPSNLIPTGSKNVLALPLTDSALKPSIANQPQAPKVSSPDSATLSQILNYSRPPETGFGRLTTVQQGRLTDAIALAALQDAVKKAAEDAVRAGLNAFNRPAPVQIDNPNDGLNPVRE